MPPQRRSHSLHRRGRVPAPDRGEKLYHVEGTEACEIEGAVAEGCFGEKTYEALVTVQRLLSQSSYASLVSLEGLDKGVEAAPVVNRHRMLLVGRCGPKEHPAYAEFREEVDRSNPLP